MTKSFVYKLTVEIEKGGNITSSTSADNTSLIDAVKHFNAMIKDRLLNLDFVKEGDMPTYLSELNGGYAIYSRFTLDCDLIRVKLLIDVRTGDHSSKPDIKTKTDRRLKNDVKEYHYDPDSIDIEDVYCKQPKDTLVYYIGKSDSYSCPFDSEEDAILVLLSRIKKFLSEKFTEAANSMLECYPKGAIEAAESFVKDTDDLNVSEDEGGVIKEHDTFGYVKELRQSYILSCFESDVIDSADEFDTICELIRLRDMFR